MEFYKLTDNVGTPLARTTNNPNNLNWRILQYLDFVHFSSREKIIDHFNKLGVPQEDIVASLSRLKRVGAIKDTSSTVEV